MLQTRWWWVLIGPACDYLPCSIRLCNNFLFLGPSAILIWCVTQLSTYVTYVAEISWPCFLYHLANEGGLYQTHRASREWTCSHQAEIESQGCWVTWSTAAVDPVTGRIKTVSSEFYVSEVLALNVSHDFHAPFAYNVFLCKACFLRFRWILFNLRCIPSREAFKD